MSYRIAWDDARVVVTYSAETSDEEVLEAVGKLQGHPHFYDVDQALHDFRDCTACRHSEAVLLDIAAHNIGAASASSIRSHSCQIAVLTDRQDVAAMVDDFNKLGLNPFPIKVFGTYQDADDWLKLTRPQVSVECFTLKSG